MAVAVLMLPLSLSAQKAQPRAASLAKPAQDNAVQARALVAGRRYAEAIAIYRRLTTGAAAKPLSVDDAVAYATALASTGDVAAAEMVVRSGLEQTPESAALNDTLGALTAQAGHMEEAIGLFQKAVAADPSYVRAQYHLGTALLGTGHAAEALAPLQAAAKASPDSFDVQLQLGRAQSAMHQDAPALQTLGRAVTLRKSAPHEAVYQLALALQGSGDAAAALPLFTEAIEHGGPRDGAALTNYALAKVQTGDANGALVLYARALAAGPDTPTLREDYGAAYLQQAKLNEALEQFRAGLALDPASAHLHYDVGLALKLKDDLAGAVLEFERAAELDPALPDPAYTLGVIYMQQGKSADAITQLKKATTLQPLNGEAWSLLGNVLKDAGDPGAPDALKHAIQLQPDQPSLHVQLAAIYAQSGLAQQAAAERKLAAELSRAAIGKQRASFALRSGRTLLEQGKLAEAEVQLQNAIGAEPENEEAHNLLAEVYARQGHSADAATERAKAESSKHAGPKH